MDAEDHNWQVKINWIVLIFFNKNGRFFQFFCRKKRLDFAIRSPTSPWRGDDGDGWILAHNLWSSMCNATARWVLSRTWHPHSENSRYSPAAAADNKLSLSLKHTSSKSGARVFSPQRRSRRDCVSKSLFGPRALTTQTCAHAKSSPKTPTPKSIIYHTKLYRKINIGLWQRFFIPAMRMICE